MLIKNYLLACSVTLLVACGGGSDSSSSNDTLDNTPEPVIPAPQLFTGQFIDAAVEGLNYRTATQSGITNAEGAFSFAANEKVTFSIGGITFPEVDAQAIITPLELFETTDINHQAVVNMLRLLQSLDDDGVLDNGIKIPSIIHTLAENITIDFSSDQFIQLVENLLSASPVVNMSLVSVDDAIYHFQQSLDALNLGNNTSCEQTHEMVGWNGTFSTLAHNVAGKATIIDDCTIEISQFDYDGGGPEVYFYAAINHQYSAASAFAVSNRITGTTYSNSTLTLKLPSGKTLDDLTGLSVWCVDFAANFGQMEFTP